STMISLPNSSDSLVKPRRSIMFGLPHSTIQLVTLPSASVISIWIQAWGLIHSILVTLPTRWTGFFSSNSAWKAWCAHRGSAQTSDRSKVVAAGILLNIRSSPSGSQSFLGRAGATENIGHGVISFVASVLEVLVFIVLFEFDEHGPWFCPGL